MTQGAERVDKEIQVAQLAGDRQALLQERPRGLSVPALQGDTAYRLQRTDHPDPVSHRLQVLPGLSGQSVCRVRV